jgi:FkbM family methyltransferase
MPHDSNGNSLEELLSESVSHADERARTAFDRMAGPLNRSLVLFGAGGIGRKTLLGLRKLGIEPLAFTDNNPALWSTRIADLPVLSPREAAEKYGRTATFVVTIWRGEGTEQMGQRMKQLLDLGCERVVPFGQLYWKYPDVFTPHYAFDLPNGVLREKDLVRNAFSLLADEASRREFVAQIRWRLLLDFDGLPLPVSHTIYFPDDLVTPQDEVFVDAGAYDGDTIRTLLARTPGEGSQVIAFEPDPLNFGKLSRYVEALPEKIGQRIELHSMGLGSKRETVFFAGSGTSAATVATSGVQVAIAPLDELIGDRRVTYLKMDIEGAELDALQGAQKCIQRDMPVLTVCSYHKQDHLWRIPLLIHSLCDKYRFFLRPHLMEVWDLVWYAIPENRLIGRTVEF